MFENSSEELAYHKLLILYILEKINMDLTNSQITQVVLETEVMNYFSLQQFLAQLMESKFLTIYEDSNKEYYYAIKSLCGEDEEDVFYRTSELVLREFEKMEGKYVALGLVKITFPVEEIAAVPFEVKQ